MDGWMDYIKIFRWMKINLNEWRDGCMDGWKEGRKEGMIK